MSEDKSVIFQATDTHNGSNIASSPDFQPDLIVKIKEETDEQYVTYQLVSSIKEEFPMHRVIKSEVELKEENSNNASTAYESCDFQADAFNLTTIDDDEYKHIPHEQVSFYHGTSATHQIISEVEPREDALNNSTFHESYTFKADTFDQVTNEDDQNVGVFNEKLSTYQIIKRKSQVYFNTPLEENMENDVSTFYSSRTSTSEEEYIRQKYMIQEPIFDEKSPMHQIDNYYVKSLHEEVDLPDDEEDGNEKQLFQHIETPNHHMDKHYIKSLLHEEVDITGDEEDENKEQLSQHDEKLTTCKMHKYNVKSSHKEANLAIDYEEDKNEEQPRLDEKLPTHQIDKHCVKSYEEKNFGNENEVQLTQHDEKLLARQTNKYYVKSMHEEVDLTGYEEGENEEQLKKCDEKLATRPINNNNAKPLIEEVDLTISDEEDENEEQLKQHPGVAVQRETDQSCESDSAKAPQEVCRGLSCAESFLCEFCGQTFNVFQYFQGHMSTHLRLKQINDDDLKRQSQMHLNKRTSCPRCPLNFTSQEDSLSHLMSHFIETPCQCLICTPLTHQKRRQQYTNFKTNFEHRRNEEHPQIHPVLPVQYFEEGSVGQSKAHADLSNLHGRNEKGTTNPQVLPRQNPPNYSSIHQRSFAKLTNERSLRNEILTHFGEKPLACSYCPASFCVDSELQAHLRKHFDERPFSCPICPLKFKWKMHLHSHMNGHSNEKPYRCEICRASFKRKHNLKRHLMLHTVKPFSCPYCPKEFMYACRLKIHLRTHTGKTTVPCHPPGKIHS